MFKKKSNGIALVTVLIILVVLFILGSAIMIYANSTFLASSWQRNSVNALYLAQAGLIYTYHHLGENDKFLLTVTGDSCTQNIDMSFGDSFKGSFVVKTTLIPGNKVDVDSTGYSGTVKRKIHAVFDSKNSGSRFEWYP